MHSINPQTITSILMVRHDAVGDMIVALPAMYAIKAHYPNARVTVMVSNYSPNRQIIENEGIADEILVTPSPQGPQLACVMDGRLSIRQLCPRQTHAWYPKQQPAQSSMDAHALQPWIVTILT